MSAARRRPGKKEGTTSRKPDDLPAFCDKMPEEIAEGAHAGRPD